jgi:CRISPR-associated exonuclease Cas4
MIDFDLLIDSHVKREHRPKGVGKYYPSEVGNCMRKVWFSYKFPQEIKPELRKIFELGNILHDFVVEVLKSEKTPEIELLQSEFPFKEKVGDLMISGRVDNLIKVKASGKILLVEVKSAKNINYIKEPSHTNIVQLQLYMHFTGVHNGILLYVDKTNLKTKMFEIDYDETKALEIIDRFKKLHKSITENEIPEPEAKQQENLKWMCTYCEYKEKCDKY